MDPESAYLRNKTTGAETTMMRLLGINKYPLDVWDASNREYMSETSWIRFAFFLAAGHDGEVMTTLREIANGIETADLKQQHYNAGLGKVRVLKIAAEKARLGSPAPKTREEVNQKGPHVERMVGPLDRSE